MYVCVFLSFINSAENQPQTMCQALARHGETVHGFHEILSGPWFSSVS